MNTKRDTTSMEPEGTSSSTSIAIKITESASAGAYRKFEERLHLKQEDLEYPRLGKEPGLVLVFNQVRFDNDPKDRKKRNGSTTDVNRIVKCMQHHGYNVTMENIMTDGTREQVLGKLQQVSNEDHPEVNSLIVFFLSHGDKLNVLETKDGTIQTCNVWTPFINCKWLENKPKMFIFQACKGDEASNIPLNPSSPLQKKDDFPSDILPWNTLTSNVIGPDMVIVYSTIEGKVSFRDSLRGSWFIQELCTVFNMYGRRDDVLSLITRATKCVSRNYFELPIGTVGPVEKQMPMYISTLRKKFYLNRNKDRHQKLKLLDAGKEILDVLRSRIQAT